MEFKVKALAVLRLCTTNYSKSKEWYESFFSTKPFEESNNFVSFNIAGVILEIVPSDLKNPGSTGGSIAYWQVDKLNLVIIRAIELGGIVYRGPLEIQETKQRIVQIQDPMGNVIGFQECL